MTRPSNFYEQGVREMFHPNQTVYYKLGPLYLRAVFLRYSGQACILATPQGEIPVRSGRVVPTDPSHTGKTISRENHSLATKK